MLRMAWVVTCLLAAMTAAAADSQQPKTFTSHGQPRTYSEFAPDSIDPGAVIPMLIVLHGSGGRGSGMVDLWREVAQRNGFLVVGPDSSDPAAWHLKQDNPEIFRDLVMAVAREHFVDTKRIYLFGQSGGAVYALTLSLLESEFFAATAVHAGAWRETKEYRALDYAQRKIPIALYVGNEDPFFPVRDVKKTEKALQRAGHPASLTIIPRHGHDYREVAAQINPAVWEFLKAVTLPASAKFQEYE
jgi:poly(3-hydroxybutyrate) depolymerase